MAILTFDDGKHARKSPAEPFDASADPIASTVETLHDIAHNCWTIRELCEFVTQSAGNASVDPSTIVEAIRQIANLSGYLADRATDELGGGEYHRIADDANWLSSRGGVDAADYARTAARICKAISQD